MEPSQEYEITPTTLVYGGEALARLPDGRAVFIPYALPDEELRIRLVEEKERYARGEIIEIIKPSPLRIQPRCPHFGECGGCHYQHIPYALQLEIKADVVRDQLVRIGGFEDPPVRSPIASPGGFTC